MFTKKFQRNIENFNCINCGTYISGNGYTNHCSECLCSKHVDINPGDRAENCKGLMRPINLLHHNKKGIVIVHKCEKCGITRNNKSSPKDNLDVLLTGNY